MRESRRQACDTNFPLSFKYQIDSGRKLFFKQIDDSRHLHAVSESQFLMCSLATRGTK